MNKKEFITATLIDMKIPLLTKNGKDLVHTIEHGYRESNWSAAGFCKMVKKFFPNKPKGDSIFNYLLEINKVGHCNFCDTIKPSDNFQGRPDNKSKTRSLCRDCQYPYKVELQGYSYLANSSAKYRAAKISAIPPWANLSKIKEIYDNCPEGYHVDHIFPLQAENSCGLHVENNLQYLPARDNLRKSNKVPSVGGG